VSPEDSAGEPVVNAAAAVSLVPGSVLLRFPATVGRWLGVDSGRRVLRTIGLVDLALAPSLYFGRPQWPSLVARALLTAGAATCRGRVTEGGF
jgi:hypothetical protein